MPERAYHHGNLRAELLRAAEQTLRDEGADRISLRDLARQAGVSHAAPSRHFPDRRALLAALAADGFARLGRTVGTAIEKAGTSIYAQLRAAVGAFVDFAAGNAALLDLMFTVGKAEQSAEMREATGPLYATFAEASYPRIVAANGEKMTALAGALADGSMPAGQPPAFTAQAREALGPDKLLVVAMSVVLDTADPQGSPDAVASAAAAHREAGADHVVLLPSGTSGPDLMTGVSQLEQLAPALLRVC
jgi:AcrR family transcriptional regulator